MNNVKIARYQNGQEISIYQLIKKVYDEFVSPDYTEEGNMFFYDWINPQKIAERQQNQRNILVATIDSEIVGMIEIRDNNRISLLFVDKLYQGQGIARKLFQQSLKNCMQKDSNLDKFYVHASPFSIPVYKKLGFIETDYMQEKFGIKYLPMEMTINNQNID
jgi:GNAT superfamily N-acetyltransferase